MYRRHDARHTGFRTDAGAYRLGCAVPGSRLGASAGQHHAARHVPRQGERIPRTHDRDGRWRVIHLGSQGL